MCCAAMSCPAMPCKGPSCRRSCTRCAPCRSDEINLIRAAYYFERCSVPVWVSQSPTNWPDVAPFRVYCIFLGTPCPNRECPTLSSAWLVLPSLALLETSWKPSALLEEVFSSHAVSSIQLGQRSAYAITSKIMPVSVVLVITAA